MRGGIDNIIDQLKLDEGEVLHVYPDKYGIPTAGVGHNLKAHEITNLPMGAAITQAQCDLWLKEDMDEVNTELTGSLPFVWEIDVVRRGVFQNMCFEMGIHRLLGFTNTIALAKIRDWAGTSRQMLLSKWANSDSPARAVRLAEQIRSGVWQ